MLTFFKTFKKYFLKKKLKKCIKFYFFMCPPEINSGSSIEGTLISVTARRDIGKIVSGGLAQARPPLILPHY